MIADVGEFHEVLGVAEELAQDRWLITFGIRPTFPATGYGYLKCGESLGGDQGRHAFRVEHFMEKPDRKTAEQFLEEGGYYWNSGMFVWRSDVILAELQRNMPLLYQGLSRIRETPEDQNRVTEIFEGFEKISIDYGVMEKADRVAMIPCGLGWSDVGSWNAVKDFLPVDQDGVASNCSVETVEARDCLVFAEKSRLVALIGVTDLVVVDTPNALLVCAGNRTQEVKKVVEQLRQAGARKHL
jgi:mannose-1-phosphate guanylyltransferase